MMTLLDAALAYGDDRLPVFACLPMGKQPAVSNGFHAATTNPETIKRFWRIADRNIGIPTGALSRVWVLDIDGDDGAASLRELEAQHGELPATWISSTGRGWHVWLRYTGPIPSSTGRIAPSLDVKADGGYVVAPPSVHPSGRSYTWVVPPEGEPAEAPGWLVALARKRPTPSISERALANIRRPNGKPDALRRCCARSRDRSTRRHRCGISQCRAQSLHVPPVSVGRGRRARRA